MKTEHTLRYLLLRHLEERDTEVEPARFREVMRSLSVVVQADRFVVTWRDGAVKRTREFPRAAFAFYGRGDGAPAGNERTAERDHETLARAFADEVFGVRRRPTPVAAATAEPYRAWTWAAAAGVASTLVGLAGLDAVSALALAAALVASLAPRARVVLPIALAVLAGTGPPAAALAAAGVVAVLEGLDPNAHRKRLRVVTAGIAVLIAGARLAAAPIALGLDVGLGTAIVSAAAVAAVRILYAGPVDPFTPLGLPAYCLGLYLDGYARASLAGLALLWVWAAGTAWLHRVWPVQRGTVRVPSAVSARAPQPR